MTKAKSYKHMDKTSGQMAAFLDKKREAAKKRKGPLTKSGYRK